LSHGNVSDGDVKGHRDGKERGDENDAADSGLGDERLWRKKFDNEGAKDGREDHQGEGDTENVPEALEERADSGNEW
jgi:hypothetical protein